MLKSSSAILRTIPTTSSVYCSQIREAKGGQGFGPYRPWRPFRMTTGVHEPLLKYHIVRRFILFISTLLSICLQVREKHPWEQYGIQDQRDKQRQKGKVAQKLPVKVSLKKDHVYAWCACGYSWKQVKKFANKVEKFN